MALTHGDDITKDAPALGGKGHILVVAAKEPLFVGQLQQDLIKKQVQAREVKSRNLLGASWVST